MNTRFPNLYRLAVTDDEPIKWHSFAASENSSQALCLSAFGSLRAAEFERTRNRVVGQFVGCAFPSMRTKDRPRRWQIEVEAEEPQLLSEHGRQGTQPTSIDALVTSSNDVVAVEAKFDRDAHSGFGTCSQYNKGNPASGKCAGFVGPGSDIATKTAAWCRLENWEGLRSPRNYWALGRRFFQSTVFREQRSGGACPLRGSNYQLMRNFLFAAAYAQKYGKEHFGVLVICPAANDKLLVAQVREFQTAILLPEYVDHVRLFHYEDWIQNLTAHGAQAGQELAAFLRNRMESVRAGKLH